MSRCLVLVPLAACGGLLGGGGGFDGHQIREAVAHALGDDAELASAICGYAVTGLDTFDNESKDYPGVDARPRSGRSGEAEIRGKPRAAPGVPAGESCAAHIEFEYATKQITGNHGGGWVSWIEGPVKVVSRTSVMPAGVEPRRRFAREFVIPIALDTNMHLSQTLTSRPIWTPETQNLVIYGDYEIAFEHLLHVTARCLTNNDTPRIELYGSDQLIATMSTDGSGSGDVKSSRPDVAVAVNWLGGRAYGYLISTPGTYQIRVLADCTYTLELELRLHPPPPEREPTP